MWLTATVLASTDTEVILGTIDTLDRLAPPPQKSVRRFVRMKLTPRHKQESQLVTTVAFAYLISNYSGSLQNLVTWCKKFLLFAFKQFKLNFCHLQPKKSWQITFLSLMGNKPDAESQRANSSEDLLARQSWPLKELQLGLNILACLHGHLPYELGWRPHFKKPCLCWIPCSPNPSS